MLMLADKISSSEETITYWNPVTLTYVSQTASIAVKIAKVNEYALKIFSGIYIYILYLIAIKS